MADVVSRKKRSQMMSGIRGKDTKPELFVRRALYGRGYRYRLHSTGIAGKPDITLRKHKAIVYVHGCFWHKHDCHLFKWPKTRTDFWRKKLEANSLRDQRNINEAQLAGWRVCIVWECALKGKFKLPFEAVIDKIDLWLKGREARLEIMGGQDEPRAAS